MKQTNISLAEAIDVIMASKGKMITVEFTKRTDGTHRVMNCRLGVRKHLTGEGSKYSFADKDLIPVFDCKKMAYRVINARSVKKVRAGGKEYAVK